NRRFEEQVAFDAEAERQARPGKFGEAEPAQLGAAEAEVGEAEQRVAVAVEFARQPCRRTNGIEQLDHRRGVVAGRAFALGGVGAQRRTLRGRQEGHAAALPSPASAQAASCRASSQSSALLAALARSEVLTSVLPSREN